ncbi:unnamed protein product [Clonostachys chloroleuca]|uniref:Uncharacterized protein n=1 Tax=Clonostachys chloroleuca TaxID=1926264 RepID=A0AA35M417_9HYPO|nr:unnamed protein product [Clonostachys chloroleuca]
MKLLAVCLVFAAVSMVRSETTPFCTILFHNQPRCCEDDSYEFLSGSSCSKPQQEPTSLENFKNICNEEGLKPKCCGFSLVSYARTKT